MPEPRRIGIGTLLALAIVLWMGEYALRGLWEPDEARYAYVAREMGEHGFWFVPHLHGEPYPDKPPLYFWAVNACAFVLGGSVGGVSARLPTLLGAVLALWGAARLSERWRSREAAWRTAAVLLTCYLFWHEGGWGRLDMLLCGLQVASVCLLFSYNDAGRWWRPATAWLLMGLAVLVKGPVGLVVPAGIYAFGTWAMGKPRLLARWHWAWGFLLAAALPGAWLAMAWRQGAPPEYFQAMFGAKSFGRVLHDHHAQPFYYYATTFVPDFLPWTVFLPAAWAGLGKGALRRVLGAWLLFVVLLFTLFVGKRNIYIMAAIPAAAMLVGAGWEGLGRLSPRWTGITGWIAMGFAGLLGAAEAVAACVPSVPIAGWRLVPPAVILLGGFAALVRQFHRSRLEGSWFALFAGALFVHHVAVSTLVFPALNPLKAPIALAAEARARLGPGQPIHLYRDQLAIVPLYAERSGRLLREPAEVADLLARPGYGVIVFDREDWSELEPRFGAKVRARPFKMGSKKLVWVDFASGAPP
jgi:4-amino-4-deoxy-L-arabinose transferase-like glycosyltransferase